MPDRTQTLKADVPPAGGRRVALVIGNGAYRNATTLDNPPNDARAVADVLRQLEFEVVDGIDLAINDMDDRIAAFAEKIEGAEAALFFFAGHGLQVDGENYLVPVDAELEHEGQLQRQTIRLQDQLNMMSGKASVSILLLDCCRDNPFVRSLARRRAGATRGGVARGLAEVGVDEGSFIAFATGPGSVAKDGDGDHSPFTAALLDHMSLPGQSLGDVMTDVTHAVTVATARQQVPWYHSSLSRRFYLKAAAAPRPFELLVPQVVPPKPAPVPAPVEDDVAKAGSKVEDRSAASATAAAVPDQRSAGWSAGRKRLIALTLSLAVVGVLGFAAHRMGLLQPPIERARAGKAELLARLGSLDDGLANDLAGFLTGPAETPQKAAVLHALVELAQWRVVTSDPAAAIPDNCRAPTPARPGIDTTLTLLCSGLDGADQGRLLAILAAVPKTVWQDAGFAGERDLAILASADFEAERRLAAAGFPPGGADDLRRWTDNLAPSPRPINPVTLQFGGRFQRGNAQAIMDRLVSFGWNLAGVERTGSAAGVNEVRYGDKVAGSQSAAASLSADLALQGLTVPPAPNGVIGPGAQLDIYLSTPLPAWDDQAPGAGWCYQEYDGSKDPAGRYLVACHPSKAACVDARGNPAQKQQSSCAFTDRLDTSSRPLSKGGWANSWFLYSPSEFAEPFPAIGQGSVR